MAACVQIRIACCLVVIVCLYESASSNIRLCGRALADALDIVCGSRFHLGKRSVRDNIRPELVEPLVEDTSSQRNEPNTEESLNTPSNNDVNKPRDLISILSGRISSDLAKQESSSTNKNEANTNGNPNYVVPEDLFSAKSSMLSSEIQGQLTPSESDNISKGENLVVEERLKRYRRDEMSVVDECCVRACNFSTLQSYCAADSDPVANMSIDELRARLGMTSRGRPTLTQYLPIPKRTPAQFIRDNHGRNRSGPFFYLNVGNQATRRPLVRCLWKKMSHGKKNSTDERR